MSDFLFSWGATVITLEGCIQVTGVQMHTQFTDYLPEIGEDADPVSGLSDGYDIIKQEGMLFSYEGNSCIISHG